MVILQNGDNKYKEGPLEAREVAGETGDWLDWGTLDIVDFGTQISSCKPLFN